MKILYINSVYGKGSTGNIVKCLHNFNLQNGIESYVCYGRGKGVSDKNVYKVSNELLSKINVIRSRITGMIYSGNYIGTFKTINNIKRIKPDIVHIHNLNDQYTNEYILLKYLAKNNIKTLITLHSEQMYTATCGYTLGCNQWKSGGCISCPHIKLSTGSNVDKTKKAFIKLEKVYSFFKSDKLQFVSCTPWLLHNAKDSKLISRFNNFVILNGGNEYIFNGTNKENYFLKNKIEIDNNKRIILHVNPRIADPVKGYSFFEKLADKLYEKYNFVVVGKIPDNFNKSKNIIYLGEILNPTILSDIYSSCDITIMLSKRECFPMVIVESLLCGTPVISFECCGPDECFSNNLVRFCEYGDISTIIDLITNTEFNRKEIIDYAQKHLTSDSMCKNYIEVYKKFL